MLVLLSVKTSQILPSSQVSVGKEQREKENLRPQNKRLSPPAEQTGPWREAGTSWALSLGLPGRLFPRCRQDVLDPWSETLTVCTYSEELRVEHGNAANSRLGTCTRVRLARAARSPPCTLLLLDPRSRAQRAQRACEVGILVTLVPWLGNRCGGSPEQVSLDFGADRSVHMFAAACTQMGPLSSRPVSSSVSGHSAGDGVSRMLWGASRTRHSGDGRRPVPQATRPLWPRHRRGEDSLPPG